MTESEAIESQDWREFDKISDELDEDDAYEKAEIEDQAIKAQKEGAELAQQRFDDIFNQFRCETVNQARLYLLDSIPYGYVYGISWKNFRINTDDRG